MQTTSLTDEQLPQKIIITGASSGIGFEAVIELAIKGHQVIALSRSKEKLQNLQKITLSLNPDAVLYPIVFDIVNDDYQGLTQFIQQKWGGFNILINNAGALINKPFKELSELDMAEMFQSNVMGHFRMIQACLPFLLPNAHIPPSQQRFAEYLLLTCLLDYRRCDQNDHDQGRLHLEEAKRLLQNLPNRCKEACFALRFLEREDAS